MGTRPINPSNKKDKNNLIDAKESDLETAENSTNESLACSCLCTKAYKKLNVLQIKKCDNCYNNILRRYVSEGYQHFGFDAKEQNSLKNNEIISSDTDHFAHHRKILKTDKKQGKSFKTVHHLSQLPKSLSKNYELKLRAFKDDILNNKSCKRWPVKNQMIDQNLSRAYEQCRIIGNVNKSRLNLQKNTKTLKGVSDIDLQEKQEGSISDQDSVVAIDLKSMTSLKVDEFLNNFLLGLLIISIQDQLIENVANNMRTYSMDEVYEESCKEEIIEDIKQEAISHFEQNFIVKEIITKCISSGVEESQNVIEEGLLNEISSSKDPIVDVRNVVSVSEENIHHLKNDVTTNIQTSKLNETDNLVEALMGINVQRRLSTSIIDIFLEIYLRSFLLKVISVFVQTLESQILGINETSDLNLNLSMNVNEEINGNLIGSNEISETRPNFEYNEEDPSWNILTIFTNDLNNAAIKLSTHNHLEAPIADINFVSLYYGIIEFNMQLKTQCVGKMTEIGISESVERIERNRVEEDCEIKGERDLVLSITTHPNDEFEGEAVTLSIPDHLEGQVIDIRTNNPLDNILINNDDNKTMDFSENDKVESAQQELYLLNSSGEKDTKDMDDLFEDASMINLGDNLENMKSENVTDNDDFGERSVAKRHETVNSTSSWITDNNFPNYLPPEDDEGINSIDVLPQLNKALERVISKKSNKSSTVRLIPRTYKREQVKSQTYKVVDSFNVTVELGDTITNKVAEMTCESVRNFGMCDKVKDCFQNSLKETGTRVTNSRNIQEIDHQTNFKNAVDQLLKGYPIITNGSMSPDGNRLSRCVPSRYAVKRYCDSNFLADFKDTLMQKEIINNIYGSNSGKLCKNLKLKGNNKPSVSKSLQTRSNENQSTCKSAMIKKRQISKSTNITIVPRLTVTECQNDDAQQISKFVNSDDAGKDTRSYGKLQSCAYPKSPPGHLVLQYNRDVSRTVSSKCTSPCQLNNKNKAMYGNSPTQADNKRFLSPNQHVMNIKQRKRTN